ncbi:MAG TPA: clostripain-related cysteine peptidase [Candidatus Babeliales bacterium]|nr:clostripain-related cysteine peptidase [Candidatus Babeliales bacterium]
MKRGLAKCLFFISAFFVICGMDAVIKKPWTFLVYMAAANNLNSFAPLDLQEMMQAGSNANVNVIVYLTLQEDGQSKVTKKLYVEKGALIQIGENMVRDSGSVATLEEALQWACVDYPSDHIATVLWNHGSGPLNRSEIVMDPRGVCYDDDTNHYLTDRDCLQAFSWARDNLRSGKKFDIIAFDACLLASLEMAYTLSSCADYLVASEETIPGDGYQYAYILNKFSQQTFDSLSFAKLMITAYNQEYVGTTDYTLSITDLNAVNLLVNNCNNVAQILKTQLMGINKIAVNDTIKKCIKYGICPSFDQGIYIDLCQFYKNLLKNISGLKLSKIINKQCEDLLKEGINLFSLIIKANVTSANYKQAGGLSIYFPRYSIDFSYYGLYWTEHNRNWLNFLEAFLS